MRLINGYFAFKYKYFAYNFAFIFSLLIQLSKMSADFFDTDLNQDYMFEFYNQISEKIAASASEAFNLVKLHLERITKG